MSVNKAILIGRLGKDPELRYTQSGRAVASFSVATNERWKGQDGQKQESTTWHNIVAWGKQAEVIKEYLSKGREIYIEGRIENRSYDDKEGNKKYISEVVVQNFQFIGGRGDSGGGSDPSGPPDSAPPPPSGAASDDDDLPF
ncbi:MAG: single-stranded DNA-binding protein [candidate division Zixibacteria bacterium]|nr:single-stranded DNA-binding protein [candidate division Zixibacteria bacterium]MDH3937302.1 single-stranded DNA-binding protein [candidate division Zixibacteria bacterium]MDH4034554.1 single-stranded DNA-binding protein [candidate division Zixibacteria bacterium]